MSIRSIKEIYQLLEEQLRKSTKPMTCVDLMDIPEIRNEALAEYGKDIRIATNKLSDALGLMWRRNLLVRYPAPVNRTRWRGTHTAGTSSRMPRNLFPFHPQSFHARHNSTGLQLVRVRLDLESTDEEIHFERSGSFPRA